MQIPYVYPWNVNCTIRRTSEERRWATEEDEEEEEEEEEEDRAITATAARGGEARPILLCYPCLKARTSNEFRRHVRLGYCHMCMRERGCIRICVSEAGKWVIPFFYHYISSANRNNRTKLIHSLCTGDSFRQPDTYIYILALHR